MNETTYHNLTVAVTGATGHLGNTIVRQLVDSGIRVRAVILPGDTSPALDGLDIERVYADITQLDSLSDVFTGCTVVFHVAGLIHLDRGFRRQMYTVNVDGTKNVIEAAKLQGVRRLVFTSSIHAFATARRHETLTESSLIDPRKTFSDYSKTKSQATLIVREQAAPMEYVILYPVGITGPRDYYRSELSRFIVDFRQGNHHILPVGGYFFIDVRDAARQHIAAGLNSSTRSEYILSAGHITTGDLVRFIQDPTNRQTALFIPARLALWASKLRELTLRRPSMFVLGEHAVYELTRRYNVSSARADRELGAPQITLEQSFHDAIEWLEEQGG